MSGNNTDGTYTDYAKAVTSSALSSVTPEAAYISRERVEELLLEAVSQAERDLY